ncbi:MAG: recombinase A [Kofleriaceae bacterium]
MYMGSDLERFLAQARGAVGSVAASKIVHVDRLIHGSGRAEVRAAWELDSLRGRLVELSARGATATLTAAVELVVEAQTQAEPVAWIAPAAGTFYPPDVAESGVDLAALVVVRVRDVLTAARVAERLLRSGAFGLIVIDLCAPSGGSAELATAIQGRLVSLAQIHDAAIVCITDKTAETPSLGSLVSLRAEALRLRDREAREDVTVTVRALKDKRRGPGWEKAAKKRAPAGL